MGLCSTRRPRGHNLYLKATKNMLVRGLLASLSSVVVLICRLSTSVGEAVSKLELDLLNGRTGIMRPESSRCQVAVPNHQEVGIHSFCNDLPRDLDPQVIMERSMEHGISRDK